MSDMLQYFLASRLPIVGLVAYSIQLPDQVLVTECLSKSLYPSSAEQMLSGLVHSGRTLLPAGQDAARYCWVFEYLRVYVAARADGACLALLVENNAGAQVARVQEALADFLELAEI
jgi:hypothetical protein